MEIKQLNKKISKSLLLSSLVLFLIIFSNEWFAFGEEIFLFISFFSFLGSIIYLSRTLITNYLDQQLETIRNSLIFYHYNYLDMLNQLIKIFETTTLFCKLLSLSVTNLIFNIDLSLSSFINHVYYLNLNNILKLETANIAQNFLITQEEQFKKDFENYLFAKEYKDILIFINYLNLIILLNGYLFSFITKDLKLTNSKILEFVNPLKIDFFVNWNLRFLALSKQ